MKTITISDELYELIFDNPRRNKILEESARKVFDKSVLQHQMSFFRKEFIERVIFPIYSLAYNEGFLHATETYFNNSIEKVV